MRAWGATAALIGWAACAGTPAAGDGTGTVAERVQITDLYVRAQAPGAINTAGFFTIHNAGRAAAIVGARGSASDDVELHTHAAGPDGAMQMRRIERIELPAQGTVTLRPGGHHVMFIGLKEDLHEGARTSLTLRFDDGSERTLVAPVTGILPAPTAPHGPVTTP